MDAHTSLLLLAGGIGITPLHSIFRTLLLLHEERDFVEEEEGGEAGELSSSSSSSSPSSSSSAGKTQNDVIPRASRLVRLLWITRSVQAASSLFADTLARTEQRKKRYQAFSSSSKPHRSETVVFEFSIVCTSVTDGIFNSSSSSSSSSSMQNNNNNSSSNVEEALERGGDGSVAASTSHTHTHTQNFFSKARRPDLHCEVARFVSALSSCVGSVLAPPLPLVVASGPSLLVEQAKQASLAFGVEFRGESFVL